MEAAVDSLELRAGDIYINDELLDLKTWETWANLSGDGKIIHTVRNTVVAMSYYVRRLQEGKEISQEKVALVITYFKKLKELKT